MTVLTPPVASGSPEDPPRLTCFAIGPIGDANAPLESPERKTYEEALEIYTEVTLAACQRFSIASLRADELPDLGEITEQIRRYVREADLVIADVSGGNGNVLYELGMRHSTGRPAILLGEHGQRLFNIAAVRTIQFERTTNGLIRARKTLERTLEAVLREGLDVLTPTRIIGPAVPDQTEADEDLPGILENYALIEGEMHSFTDDLVALGHSIEEVGAIMEAATPEVVRLTQENAPTSARLALVAKFAKEVTSPADDLESRSLQFSERMKAVDGAVRGVLESTGAIAREDRLEGTEEFLNSLVELAASANENAESAEEFCAGIDGIRGVSRVLRKPLTKISVSTRRVVAASARIAEWGEIVYRLLHSEPSD